jgi:mannose-1-phosphate guanylyltransferase/phosphomannomutase
MKAMVLCAGYGTRLGRLVDEVPKPMLAIGRRPMLEHILRHLARHGFREIAVNLHFRPDVIRDYFGDGSRLGIRLVYSEEPELLGTAGSVKKMSGFLAGGEPFLVHYGDVVTDQDFTAMLDFHRRRQALATLLVHARQQSNSLLGIDAEQRIVAFLERPTPQQRSFPSPWVNSGIAICDPALLDEIPRGVVCDLPRDVYPRLLSGGRLFAFPLSGYRCAVDSPERLDELRGAAALGIVALDPEDR